MVDFSKMIDESRIVDLKATTKEEALRELVDVLATSPNVTDKDELLKAIFEREKVISTGVGIEVALPHVKIPSVKDFVIAIGRSHKGIDFDSLDDKPVYIIVMIGANDKQAGDFLKVLAQLVLKLKNKNFRKAVMFAKSPKRIRELFISNESLPESESDEG
ncbi:MAG: PTS sugar transporter subunit IIA [Candidatus Hydrogenedentota bacterium]|jgi:fructose-specific phosphotransferase system IIA component|uniref:PTS system, fructose-specific IIA component n=1 Tax=Sumerlaea chitinivorans TaxID=2250252 RepID=A0A2Z4Y273_SUMC1|nr:PTS system, fructose-specific IIA component [Candidatus Sumerlaea chitinivorans]RMH30707.1 MAG: PTS sugar transporter subunit IIA [Candidatus Hydrogenedentota bacterium]